MYPLCRVSSLALLLLLPLAAFKQPFEHILPGVWTPFHSWARSTPDARSTYAAAATVVGLGTDNSPQEMMIMYGGAGYEQKDMITWIYDPELKTWKLLFLSPHPPVKAFHSMVTLCGRHVVLFGGADTRNAEETKNVSISGCKDETWIFDMSKKEWKFVDVKSKETSLPLPRCNHAATVLHQPLSGCTCKESMFIYGGKSFLFHEPKEKSKDLSDLWELRCINDGYGNDTPGFMWIPIYLRNSSALELEFPQAVSIFNKSTLILSGLKNNAWHVWSFNITGRTWVERGEPRRATKVARMVYITGQMIQSETDFHILIGCCKDPFWTFNLETTEWYSPYLVPDVPTPQLRSDTATVATVGGHILAYGGGVTFRFPQQTLWSVSVLKPDVFHKRVIKVDSPQLQYRRAMVGGIVDGNKVFIFGGFRIQPQQVFYDDTWTLDLASLHWTKETVTGKPPGLVFAAGAVLQNRTLVVIFGGVGFEGAYDGILKFNAYTFVYNNSNKHWTKLSMSRDRPPVRVMHTALAMNESTMIVLGGVTRAKYLFNSIELEPHRDVWAFTIESSVTHPTTAKWTQLSSMGPHTYVGHAVSVFLRKLVIYGGINSSIPIAFDSIKKVIPRKMRLSDVMSASTICSDGMWEYDVDVDNWSELNYTRQTGPGARCFPSTARVGYNMIIYGGCSSTAALRFHTNTYTWDFECSVESQMQGVWSYCTKIGKWTQLTMVPPFDRFQGFTLILEWKGMILTFGGVSRESYFKGEDWEWKGFGVYKPECPPGTYTFDFELTGCLPCPFGLFSSSFGPNCTECPSGLSTPSIGSRSIEVCSVCSASDCDHGHCRVTVPGPDMYCECDFGYTKNDDGHCSVATYYLAGSGFLAGVLLVFLVAAVLFRSRKARKRHQTALRDKDRELSELTNGWVVDFREIKLRGRIDGRSPGGFGDVYRAVYREMTVAVKKLKPVMLELERIEMEFDREVEVMRTIRHPNIVLFLGAGRSRDDHCPFIVMEYMSRGSLSSILRTTSISLTNSQRIRFALEAAKGMRFLHGLCPPRIHRDLKSGNLLVSERWVVKVADFGSARLVKEEAVDQPAVRGTGPLSLNAPLLQPQYELSTCVGTAFWTAPELLRGDSYGTASDVYSFGVVLWEIWSRKLPFDEYYFPTVIDLKQAVIGGTRPTVSSNWPSGYVGLITDCWSDQAVYRPTFRQILARLENFNEQHPCKNVPCRSTRDL